MDVWFESCESCIGIGMVKGVSKDECLQRVCNWMNGYKGKILMMQSLLYMLQVWMPLGWIPHNSNIFPNFVCNIICKLLIPKSQVHTLYTFYRAYSELFNCAMCLHIFKNTFTW
jgi:hypothetical protein